MSGLFVHRIEREDHLLIVITVDRISNLAQQSLAVGDELGNVHVLEIPRNMRKMLNNERNIMDTFLSHEEKKVGYVKERNQFYAEEGLAAAAVTVDGEDAVDIEEGMGAGADIEAEETRKKELESAEAEYRAFEEKMRAELGLDEEVDVEGVEVLMTT